MAQISTLNVLQHNVRNWNNIRVSLSNTYRILDPHIILLNSHGCSSDNKIKIFNYYILQVNKTDKMHDGAAIAIRRDLRFRPVPGLSAETLAELFFLIT